MACLPVVWLGARSVEAQTRTDSLNEPSRPHPSSLEWKDEWSRFRLSQAVVTGALAVGVVGGDLLLDRPEEARWRGTVLLDGRARSALCLDSYGARHGAATASDVLLRSITAYAFVIEPGAVAWGIHGSPDVALQMYAINAQSFLLTTLVTLLSKVVVARERPYGQRCEAGKGEEGCDSSRNLSFLSGHSAMAFTGAGLICAHHAHLPLYGGGTADELACPVALAAATATGALRIVADRHYLSDVMAGAALGVVSGYVLPSLLHYEVEEEVDRGSWSGTLVPMATSDTVGASFVATF